MKIRGLTDYDIINYKEPTLFIAFPYCNFKCDIESASQNCQNSELIKQPLIDIPLIKIFDIYKANPLTKGIVCGGLEPFDSFDELEWLCHVFRDFSNDIIIIYTGYTEDELIKEVNQLKKIGNIIIKFGRFVPNETSHYDEILGVNLASNNQYARYYE